MASVERDWIVSGKVRAREADGAVQVVVDGLTTQARYYKPLIYEFFRKVWRGSRPGWGEFSVEIVMEYVGEPPWLDLDNLAKAILDAIKGYVFHDDAQRLDDRRRLLLPADLEVAQRALGLRAPVAVRGDLDGSEGVGLGAGVRHHALFSSSSAAV